MSEYETVAYDLADGICVVGLNRPTRRNAYTTLMGVEVGQALAEADADDAVRAVVVTGVGEAFCVGADLDQGSAVPDGGEHSPDLTPPDWWRFPSGQPYDEVRLLHPYEVRKPVIAAINGHAVGAGMTLAMLCDIRYAAEDAKLGFPFAARGLIPDLMAHWTVPRVVGIGVALELFFTSGTVSGADAAAIGLVNKALPAADVLSKAIGLAAEIARVSAPVSLALCKQLVWQSLELPLAASRAQERAMFNVVAHLPDAMEGVQSFLEKRVPDWKGRVSVEIPRRGMP